MSFPRRDLTEKLLEAIEEGLVDRDTVIMACLKFMTEEQVKAMCKANDLLIEEG